MPPEEARGRIDRQGGGQPYRYRVSASELAPREEDWDAVEEHVLGEGATWSTWFDRGELGGICGERFVEALDFEATRLLDVERSTLRRMADAPVPAEDLADAQALLSTLFRRYMRGQWDQRE